MMAEWNREEADGTASRARIMLAPLLCPATVILDADPPKAGTVLAKNWRAVTMSFRPRLVVPSGPRKPNYEQSISEIVKIQNRGRLTAPRRYWTTATMAPVALASLEPSSPGLDAPPSMKEPPWILIHDENGERGQICYKNVPHHCGHTSASFEVHRDVKNH